MNAAKIAKAKVEGERSTAKRAQTRDEKTRRARAKAGIVVEAGTPRLFWPSADRKFTIRLKVLSGPDIKNVRMGDIGYIHKVGHMVPRPCVEAALAEKISGPVRPIGLLIELLRTTFYLNKWCAKGYKQGRASDQGRYYRKDECLKQACELATEIPDLEWGWNSEPNQDINEFSEDANGNLILLNPYSQIVYFNLSDGQVSFHTQNRYRGPKNPGEWSGRVNELFPGDAEPPEWFVKGMKTYHGVEYKKARVCTDAV